MTSRKDQIKKDVLKWINTIRRSHGKGNLPRIRKGQHSCYDCPITNSLKDCFPEYRVTTMGSGKVMVVKILEKSDILHLFSVPIEEFYPPPFVTEFVMMFDHKEYPELKS